MIDKEKIEILIIYNNILYNLNKLYQINDDYFKYKVQETINLLIDYRSKTNNIIKT